MFESVKQNNRPNGMVYVVSLLVSLLAHVAIVCLLVVVPLIFFTSLQAEELLTFLYAPPTPPPPPPPPTPPPAPGSRAPRPVDIRIGSVPDRIPDGVLPEPPDSGDVVDIGSAITRIPGPAQTVGTGNGNSIISMLAPGPVVAPEAPRRPDKRRDVVRVASLEPSKLIRKVSPVYPELARRARVSGDVLLDAVIDEEGNVTGVKVLSGHILLVDAAVNAVRQWKYTPTILSGEPVPIIATVTVIFRLN